MSRPDVDELERAMVAQGREVRRDLRQTMLSGLALTIPFFITILVLTWALNTLSNALTPVTQLLTSAGVVEDLSSLVIDALAATVVIGVVLVVGLAARHGPDTTLGSRIDMVMQDLPGIGSIYTSVEMMSEVLLQSDTESFREVKLVEFPHEESYAVAFLTAESPETIATAAGVDDMVTVFVPMAPNPVMGGHLVNLPTERVHDVDLTVEEGMRAVLTSGIAVDSASDAGPA